MGTPRACKRAARATPCRPKMQRQIAEPQTNGSGSAGRNEWWQKERALESAAFKSARRPLCERRLSVWHVCLRAVCRVAR